MAYRLRTLGTLRLSGPTGELLASRRRELSLLAYLCANGPAPRTRAELATLLWGDRSEARARHSLRQALLELKRALGDALRVSDAEVEVAAGAVRLDVVEFEAQLRAGAVEDALALWEGDFLAPVDGIGAESFRGWLDAERARLRRRLCSALEEWTARAQRVGDVGAVVERSARWTALFPADAEAAARHVDALHQAGRGEEALARYAAFSAGQATPEEELPEAWRALGERLERERRERLHSRPRLGATALFVPDTVGRQAALEELKAAWHRVREGQTEVARVSGEEGSGKTRLIDELLRWLGTRGEEVLVLRTRAYEAERQELWSTARELLSPLRGAPGLGGASPEALAELAELVPGIRARFADLPAAQGTEPALHAAAAEVLACVAEEVPVALVVDDLSVTDPSSLRLVAALARRLTAAAVSIVFTVRTGGSATLARAAEIRDIPVTRRVSLTPLSAAEVEAMLASMLELAPPVRRELAACLHAETGGNPLYVHELTAALVEEGHLHPDPSGRWHTTLSLRGPLPLPAGIREIVARRIGQLPGEVREVLGVAAVLGERFELKRLEEVAGLEPAALSAALDGLLARRLIRELPQQPGSYAFVHALLRRVAYNQLLPARRAALLGRDESGGGPWYRRVWSAPATVFVTAGAEGEWLAARLRLPVMGILLVLPVVNLAAEPAEPAHQVGFAVALLAVLLAVGLYLLLRREGYRPWLGFLSSAVDVSLVSLALLGFSLVGEPYATVNSKPIFDIYYLAILGSSLRFDRRICLTAGAVATLEYLALLLWVTSRWELNAPRYAPYPYGLFSWYAQLGRILLFVAATLLAWELVRRGQQLREQATRDLATGLWSESFLRTHAAAELARARRFGHDVAFALLQIDGLARLTARYGGRARDEVLQAVAGVLRSGLSEADVVARHGADEVALLLAGVDHTTATRKLTPLLADLALLPATLPDVLASQQLGFRLGVASFPADGSGLDGLVHQAEARAQRAPSAPTPSLDPVP